MTTSPKEATLIRFKGASGRESELDELLVQGAGVIARTEPATLLWYGLSNEKGAGIFDLFPDEAGRAAHFNGQVAAALQTKAGELVAGGWEGGVLPNVQNFQALAVHEAAEARRGAEATYIELEANPGKEAALADFLTGAARVVAATEPDTLFWTALKKGERTYAIFDVFRDAAGRSAHFSGAAAAALKANASELVRGGWEEGVLTNVHHFRVIAAAE